MRGVVSFRAVFVCLDVVVDREPATKFGLIIAINHCTSSTVRLIANDQIKAGSPKWLLRFTDTGNEW